MRGLWWLSKLDGDRANVVGVICLPPIGIGLTYPPKIDGNSPYVPIIADGPAYPIAFSIINLKGY